MWRIAQIIVKNGSIVLFVILQCVSLFWVVKYNQVQQKIYLHSYQLAANQLTSRYKNVVNYFNLRKQYDSVSAENARLLSHMINASLQSDPRKDSLVLDAGSKESYQLIPARVVNNSLEKRNNTLTLDKGGRHHIAPGMGVITSKGIVGIVTDTSAHYSLVLSVLHGNSNISARLKRGGFFGSLVWDGRNPSLMQLEAIQKYADVRLGDTVVTSGYSTIFPKGLPIGTVDVYRVKDGSFTYDIQVALSQSLTNVDQVYVVNINFKGEKEALEKNAGKYE